MGLDLEEKQFQAGGGVRLVAILLFSLKTAHEAYDKRATQSQRKE